MTDYVKNMRKYIGHERLLLVGAGVAIHKDGKILLQKRKDNGCWANHGGAVEIAEKVETAAKRELFEETGLIANSLEFLGVFSGEELLYTYPNGDMVSFVVILYLCENFSGEVKGQEEEVAELKWFSIDNLPENISPPDKPMMEAVVRKLKKV
ncbi:MAG: NUDIX hydrolase [Defluviitaleaceae bacterium]|nr:NUDIX hydrolase [Defluviitaleaceae bacterium]